VEKYDTSRHGRHRSPRTREQGRDNRSSSGGDLGVDEGRVARSTRSPNASGHHLRSDAADKRALFRYVIHQVRSLNGQRSFHDDQTRSYLSATGVKGRLRRCDATASLGVEKRSSPLSPRRSGTTIGGKKLALVASKTVSLLPPAVGLSPTVRSRQPCARFVIHRASARGIRFNLRSLLRTSNNNNNDICKALNSPKPQMRSSDSWTSITDLELRDLQLLMFSLVHM